MSLSTIIGIVVGFAILLEAICFSTDSVAVFLNWPGLAIVLGGTTAATFICYPLKEAVRVFRAFLIALYRETLPIEGYIDELVKLAEKARKHGQLALEHELRGVENIFLIQAVQMLVDGYARSDIEVILNTRIEQTLEWEMNSAGIFRTMAKLSPAFGIIGTLIGLISMMQAMGSNLSQLGGALAVAFTTTFYGILLANLVFLPIAIKVEQRLEERMVLMQVIRDGVLYIKDRAPEDVVRNKLEAYLPTRRWRALRKPKPAPIQAKK